MPGDGQSGEHHHSAGGGGHRHSAGEGGIATVLEPSHIINHGDASTDMFSGQSDGDNY